ncbi:hypothetical protein E1262_14145 [Jiangella aurantiaca]|uniref:MFS transporter n=1 Tax=Jiangella aurantiaca TaxID=2530373 RepID=A0A4R5ACC4_9ACTN|nr:hypothetical protein E1262_14145 [Jiangella aurantiaca]
MTRTPAAIRLGLRENAGQFTLLVAVNALVGGMVGQQQTVLLPAGDRHGLPRVRWTLLVTLGS